MPFLKLFQDAIIWEKTKYDLNGEPDLTDIPKEIKCSLQIGKAEILNSQGNTITIDAIAIVDKEIPIGSTFWEGTIPQWEKADNYRQDLFEVVSTKVVPDIKGRNKYIEHGLKRKGLV